MRAGLAGNHGTPISTIQTGNGAVNFLAFSADNRFLICGEDPAVYRSGTPFSGVVQWEYQVGGNRTSASLPGFLPGRIVFRYQRNGSAG